MLNNQEYLTIVEAAAVLGVSRQVVHKRLRNGTAPAHIRLGDRTFFERGAVEAEAKRKGKP